MIEFSSLALQSASLHSSHHSETLQEKAAEIEALEIEALRFATTILCKKCSHGGRRVCSGGIRSTMRQESKHLRLSMLNDSETLIEETVVRADWLKGDWKGRHIVKLDEKSATLRRGEQSLASLLWRDI